MKDSLAPRHITGACEGGRRVNSIAAVEVALTYSRNQVVMNRSPWEAECRDNLLLIIDSRSPKRLDEADFVGGERSRRFQQHSTIRFRDSAAAQPSSAGRIEGRSASGTLDQISREEVTEFFIAEHICGELESQARAVWTAARTGIREALKAAIAAFAAVTPLGPEKEGGPNKAFSSPLPIRQPGSSWRPRRRRVMRWWRPATRSC